MRVIKKWVFALALLFLMQTAAAELILESIGKDKVNLGDTLTANGYIVEPFSTVALFKIMLSCNNDRPLLVRTLILTNNTKKDFSESLIIPILDESKCSIKASAEADGRTIDEARTRDFAVTKELNGNFRLDKEVIKLGDVLRIYGESYKLDGTPVTGTAVISFKQQNSVFFADTVQVLQGIVSYDFQSRDNPAGSYTVEISISELFGNKQVFNAGSFSIVNNITVVAESDQLRAMPKSTIKILGKASVLNEIIDKGMAMIDFLGQHVETPVSKGAFLATIDIPADIKSGTHEVNVRVTDEFGNVGSSVARFIVSSLVRGLTITLNKQEFLPDDVVTVIPVLKDQGGDIVKRNVTLTIVTPDKKNIIVSVAQANEEYGFTLLNTAAPGTWQIKASADGLEEVARFSVKEKKSFIYALEGQSLLITNAGNVPVTEPFEISLETFEKKSTIVRELSIGVNETTTVDISRAVVSGTYDVSVDGKVFKNIAISGRTGNDLSWLIYPIALIVLLLIVYLLFLLKKWHFHRRLGRTLSHKGRPQRDYNNDYVPINRVAIGGEQKKPFKFSVKKSSDHFIFDKPGRRESSSYYQPNYRSVSRRKDGEEKGGDLFNMFD